ncbi:MAG: hypothetical protein BroJett040_19750 [Oligoflexia bacterium]|nr:MAG: hypothetical protein BroJett040_19750 [Oligoflexia bacterium]
MSEKNQTPNQNPQTKRPKKKGPIRTEAVIPFVLVTAIMWVYFSLFFDSHLKAGFEWIGYQVVGAEVNIAKVETSFFKGTFRLQGLEVTNSEKPTHNLINIGDIRFGVLWDGLLRARIIVEEMAVEQIEIGSPRKRPGKVKPPEPPKPKSTEPSAVEKEAMKLKEQAIEKAKKDYSKNVLGDIAALMGGTSGDDQIKNIESSLPSKAKLREFEVEFKSKQKIWDDKIKSLPQGKEISQLGDRLSKVKTKDFKSPQELADSLNQINTILKEADDKFKQIQGTVTEVNNDLKTLENQLKEIDALVKKDIKDLESRFRLPKLDAQSLAMGLFHQYLDPYLGQINKYKGMAEKYVPPNLMKKDKNPPTEIKPHPREKGVTYEFGRPNSYPLFWIKKISASSKSNSSVNSADMKGLITNITSNQALIGKPTVLKFEGSFPGLEVRDILADFTIDNTKDDSQIGFNFNIGSYAMNGREVVNSPDVTIAFKKATASLKSRGDIVGLEKLNLKLTNQVQKMEYNISAKDKTIDEILKEVFAGVPTLSIDAEGGGYLPNDLSLSINSNIGPELQKGFEKQIQKKLDEAKAKLNAAINEAIGKEKTKIEGDFNKIKAQIDGEIKKVNDQINAEKSKAEAKANQAKKDSDDQANREKKKLEEQAKKALGKEGEKAVEDLKKKLGL